MWAEEQPSGLSATATHDTKRGEDARARLHVLSEVPRQWHQAVVEWLAGIGPHLYCCGHVHAAWAFQPPSLSNQICLNAGAPLMRDPTGLRQPGFLEERIAALRQAS